MTQWADYPWLRQSAEVARGVGMAFGAAVGRAVCEALAVDPKAAAEMAYRANVERREARVAAKYGFTT